MRFEREYFNATNGDTISATKIMLFYRISLYTQINLRISVKIGFLNKYKQIRDKANNE